MIYVFSLYYTRYTSLIQYNCSTNVLPKIIKIYDLFQKEHNHSTLMPLNTNNQIDIELNVQSIIPKNPISPHINLTEIIRANNNNLISTAKELVNIWKSSESQFTVNNDNKANNLNDDIGKSPMVERAKALAKIWDAEEDRDRVMYDTNIKSSESESESKSESTGNAREEAIQMETDAEENSVVDVDNKIDITRLVVGNYEDILFRFPVVLDRIKLWINVLFLFYFFNFHSLS